MKGKGALEELVTVAEGPWNRESFVDAAVAPSMTVDEREVAVLADMMDLRHGRLYDAGIVLEGGVPMQEAAAAAARLMLRERGIPGHRSAWWRVPPGTAPVKVVTELAIHLDDHRPKPHHLRWDVWLDGVITERQHALLVISDAQHVLTGRGARLVHRTWNWLIRQHPQLPLILTGAQLLPRLPTGAADDELKPYIRAISRQNLTVTWGSRDPQRRTSGAARVLAPAHPARHDRCSSTCADAPQLAGPTNPGLPWSSRRSGSPSACSAPATPRPAGRNASPIRRGERPGQTPRVMVSV